MGTLNIKAYKTRRLVGRVIDFSVIDRSKSLGKNGGVVTVHSYYCRILLCMRKYEREKDIDKKK